MPRLTVVLRKAYGGAYITMNSKDLGARPRASPGPAPQIGVMGAEQAVGIVHRRDIAAAEDPDAGARRARGRVRRRAPAARAPPPREGFVDEVIEPAAHARPAGLGPALAARARDGRSGQTGNIPPVKEEGNRP